MARAPAPCRLYVFLAREAPAGVVLRRGPTAWVQLTRWRTDRDRFEHGQWFHARVYEDRCDLSPDGTLFLYFAYKDTPRGRAEGYGEAWSAVSRPPAFTALALWPQESTYCGGGVFHGRRTLILNGSGSPHPRHKPRGMTVEALPPQFVSGWSYMQRLLRDGWLAVDGGPSSGVVWGSVANPPSRWQRTNAAGTLMLEMTYPYNDPSLPPGFGGYGVQLVLHRHAGGGPIPLEGATWADWDQQDRLVLVRNGCLYAWQQTGAPDGTLALLADFNPLRPEHD